MDNLGSCLLNGIMSPYAIKPKRLIERLHFASGNNPVETLCCAGFELKAWRCLPLANHLIDWLPDYALTEDELYLHHGNAYEKLRQAAVRVYKTEQFARRGEAGEIALHAICRDHFDTVPISPRVFYLSSSNDVVKGFDMVHARLSGKQVEIWLGESKLYVSRGKAIADAIASTRQHIERGFLTREKLLIGPQIPKSTPRYDEIRSLFESQSSIDKLLASSVFAIGILAESPAVAAAEAGSASYEADALAELEDALGRLRQSDLCGTLRINLIYLPIREKSKFVAAFDERLKGLSHE